MEVPRIAVDPSICHGKPCISGTRVPVDLIVEMLAADEGVDGVLKAYPFLCHEDIDAVLEYERTRGG